jgi:hypothetical protein
MTTITDNEYNHVLSKLQDYMLDEINIHKSLESKFKHDTLKPRKQHHMIPQVSHSQKSVFCPLEKDTLFWCFYIMRNGDTSYEMLEHKNIIVDKKLKIGYVEKIRKEKQTVKTYKFATLTHIENNLANDDIIDTKTFLTLCAIENINVIFVKNKSYFELLMNDTTDIYIVHWFQNGKFGYEKNNEILNSIKSTHYKLDNIEKPIKSLSTYKLPELVDICQKLGIEVINKETNKGKNKKDLYESIIQHF